MYPPLPRNLHHCTIWRRTFLRARVLRHLFGVQRQASCLFLNATAIMVYKPCPRCGNLNYHNTVKCCVCDMCLKPSGGKRTRSKDQHSVVHDILSWAYCGQPNSLASVTCVGCDHPLTRKRGRLTENPDVPCPTCGQPNSPASVTCVGCDQSLKHKRGRPSEVADVPCLTCGQSNGSKNVKCVGCDQLLEYKRGRPIVCKWSTADVSCPNLS